MKSSWRTSSGASASRRTSLPPRRINEIVHGKRGITADTALRLAKYFGTSAEFWINLQSHYELDRAEDQAGEQIASITPLSVA